MLPYNHLINFLNIFIMESFLAFISDAWIVFCAVLLFVVAVGSLFIKRKDVEALNS